VGIASRARPKASGEVRVRATTLAGPAQHPVGDVLPGALAFAELFMRRKARACCGSTGSTSTTAAPHRQLLSDGGGVLVRPAGQY